VKHLTQYNSQHVATERKLRVGVVFGGVSPEHEVSVITSLQAAAAMDRSRFDPIPVYIGKDGRWYTGSDLFDVERYRDLDALRSNARQIALAPGEGGTAGLVELDPPGFFKKPQVHVIDVFFLGLHGGAGEDGGLQGLCNVLNVPFTSSDVMGSAVGMDKVVSKYLCRDAGIPVVDFVAFREAEWAGREESKLDEVENVLGYPVIVKPARLGSSIGIARADDRAELDAAIEEAFRYDDKVVVEDAVEKLREINCSVLGDVDDCRPSVLEQPVRTEGEELLTYEEKYMRGGSKAGKVRVGRKQRKERSEGMASLDRLIPAPISEAQRDEIQGLATALFALFECSGVVRIDFMIDEATGRVYFNEINTIPGSLSFYLWEPSGLAFDELVETLIDAALLRHRRKNGRIRSYDVNLLSERSLQGLKTAKG
jgi:D-alanine-D-alanine ligase